MFKLPLINLKNRFKIILTVSISLLFISSNCASQTVLTTKQKMDQKLEEITLIIGDANCTSNQQCAGIAIGAKPCGGPLSFRAYSTTHTDSTKLKEIALEYKNLNKRYNKESGMMSDCSMTIQPPVSCVKHQCQLLK